MSDAPAQGSETASETEIALAEAERRVREWADRLGRGSYLDIHMVLSELDHFRDLARRLQAELDAALDLFHVVLLHVAVRVAAGWPTVAPSGRDPDPTGGR